MSTKSNKRKKKRGGRRAAPASSMPKQTKAQLKVPKGGKGRNWASLKERYMAYEFLTYEELAVATGIHYGQIGKHAAVGKHQPLTWKDERTLKTQELAEAAHEKAKREAGGLNARLREQIRNTADLLEAKGQQSLAQLNGALIIPTREAITALAESARIKQALVGQPQKATGPIGGRGQAEREDGDEEEPQGVVVVPAKQAEAAWLADQKAREAVTTLKAAKAKKDG